MKVKLLKFNLGTFFMLVLYMLYNRLSLNEFWEIKYGVIPSLICCYLYEFWLDIPILKQILMFFGKHSMNIF